MALFVLCEAKYRQGVWCDTKIRGIIDEASRRRVQPDFFINASTLREVLGKCEEESSVIVLFDSMHWLKSALGELSECRAHFILSANYIGISLPVSYSLVGTDIDAAMRATVDYLHSCGKRKIALVGVNPTSCNDCGRSAMLKKYLPEEDYSIFYTDENMIDCFDSFLEVQNDFDAAICTNDLIAICLSEHLKEHHRSGEKLFILSHTDTVMARLYGDGITSMPTNFYNCGRMLVEAHFYRLKYGLVRTSLFLPVELKVRGSTNHIKYIKSSKMPLSVQNDEVPLLKELKLPTGDIGKLERMLVSSDIIDLKIIYCLLCGFSYDAMSEFCFVSAETARYRVRKIRKALSVQKKAEAAELIRTYIKKESLSAVIREHEEKNNHIVGDY